MSTVYKVRKRGVCFDKKITLADGVEFVSGPEWTKYYEPHYIADIDIGKGFKLRVVICESALEAFPDTFLSNRP